MPHTAALHTTSQTLLAITSAVPDCLKSVAVPIEVNDKRITALVDSCSSESFIDRTVAGRLKLQISKSSRKINVASSLYSTEVTGTCYVNIRLNNTLYENVRLGVMNQNCGDVILGQDFQSRHSKIIIEYGGSQPELKIPTLNNEAICNLCIAKIPKPMLFPG